MERDYEVREMPVEALRAYERSRGADVMLLLDYLIANAYDDCDEVYARLRAMAESLVHQLHAMSESADEFTLALLYASGHLAANGYVQLVLSMGLTLRDLGGPADLGAR